MLHRNQAAEVTAPTLLSGTLFWLCCVVLVSYFQGEKCSSVMLSFYFEKLNIRSE